MGYNDSMKNEARKFGCCFSEGVFFVIIFKVFIASRVVSWKLRRIYLLKEARSKVVGEFLVSLLTPTRSTALSPGNLRTKEKGILHQLVSKVSWLMP